MAIYRLLEHHQFEPQVVDLVTAAYEHVLSVLPQSDRAEHVTDKVAKRIVELTLTGERDFQIIRHKVLRSLDDDKVEAP